MFTSKEEAEIMKIALEAELYEYQNNYFEQIKIFTNSDEKRLTELYEWFRSKIFVLPVARLYFQLLYVTSIFVNPMNVHELERI